MKQFIITQDKRVAEKLSAMGYKLFSEKSGVYTYINMKAPTQFAELDKSKIAYTNIITL